MGVTGRISRGYKWDNLVAPTKYNSKTLECYFKVTHKNSNRKIPVKGQPMSKLLPTRTCDRHGPCVQYDHHRTNFSNRISGYSVRLDREQDAPKEII